MRTHNRFGLAILVAMLVVSVGAPALAQGRVSGVVKDESGKPIDGATIVAKNPQAVPPDFTSNSDDKGRWSMMGLQNGSWLFTASADGYVPVEFRTTVTYLRANAPIEFKLAKGSPSALSGVNAKDLQGELKAADELMAARQWSEAIAAYKALLAKAPALSMLNLQIAQAYRQMKDWDNAIAAYQEVLKGDPTMERVIIELGGTYMQKGDLAKADELLTTAGNNPNADREVYYNVGEVKFANGHTDEAATWYQKAADKDPTWSKPLFKLGLVALNRGDKAGTIALMEKVIAADPDSPEAVQAKGLIEQLKK